MPLAMLSLLVPGSFAAQIFFTTYSGGDCRGTITGSFQGANGGGNTCHVFGGVSYGAEYQVWSSATCVFKSWENSDCSGLATTRVSNSQHPSATVFNDQCRPLLALIRIVTQSRIIMLGSSMFQMGCVL